MGDKYTTGQAGAVGPQSQAQNMSFNQVWSQFASENDAGKLAEELAVLRGALIQQAQSAEETVAAGEVAQAEVCAAKGDYEGVMGHLAKAGKWAFGVATAIGAGVAAAAMKGAIGL